MSDRGSSKKTAVEDVSKKLQRLAKIIIQGDFGQMRELATRELVTAIDENRQTVLMLTADARDTPVQTEKCILYLFERGAKPIATDSAGDTAAHFAARRDNLRILALLPFNAKWLRNKQGATPLMEAVRAGSLRCAKHLLHLLRQQRYNECTQLGNSKRKKLLGLKDLSGRTALDIALQIDRPDLASSIDREMFLIANQDGLISNLPVLETTVRENLELLLRSGDIARVQQEVTCNTCDLPDRLGATILMRQFQQTELLDEALCQKLLELTDPTCADVWAARCLHWAVASGNSAAVRSLLIAGASVNSRALCGSTPLMWAAVFTPVDAAATIGKALLAAGSNWCLKDKRKRTALLLAEEHEKFELAELLRGYKEKKYFDEPLELPPPFLKKWDFERALGRGGYGRVDQVLTDRGIRCAAKTIRLPLQGSDQIDSIRRKIDQTVESEKNLCRLRHDNIVLFYHITVKDSINAVLFMELLDGRTLEIYINKQPLNECTVRYFSIQICSALQCIHSQSPPVLHRDVNCTNIMVLEDSKRIKLIDFGLSISLNQSVSHVSGSAIPIGTLNFLAPELLGYNETTSVQYCRETDVWAFGCSVYQMATGARPHASVANLLQLALKLNNSGAPALSEDCSAELRCFYACCSAMERQKRKTADELICHPFLRAK